MQGFLRIESFARHTRTCAETERRCTGGTWQTGMDEALAPPDLSSMRQALGKRSIALVGLMGAGKTTVGRRLATQLSLPFRDTDHEIEAVSRMKVPDLFKAYGEPEFRALEVRVISRLMEEGPQVVATGGGAFMNPQTRALMADTAITVWLKADLDILMERVRRRGNRPLLKTADPRATMRKLIDERYPIYAQSDITIDSRNVRREVIAAEIAESLQRFLQDPQP